MAGLPSLAPSPAKTPVEFLDVVLAVSLIVAVTSCLFILAFVKIPSENVQLFTVLATGVLGLLGILANNRWGSSKGSQAKDDVIGAIATKAADTPTQ